MLEVFKPCLLIKYSLWDYKEWIAFNDEIHILKKENINTHESKIFHFN